MTFEEEDPYRHLVEVSLPVLYMKESTLVEEAQDPAGRARPEEVNEKETDKNRFPTVRSLQIDALLPREVARRRFVFRFDFRDWKDLYSLKAGYLAEFWSSRTRTEEVQIVGILRFMMSTVEVEEELMPNRNQINMPSDGQSDPVTVEIQGAGPTTPTRKFCRNRGLVLQEETAVEDSSPESYDSDRGKNSCCYSERVAREVR
ncbi:hypothetical protein OIU84_010402 [Salix udensis]|uniref:Uncharacterized protein n=1 Tax=Salix udensis TaxID=889485 RepID=A0AAD6JKX7_9ROSI|nr:hypothetical protein OIU84_010402 [Salix udensis]